ncbi:MULTISPECIES: DUF6273 domain-containing protein [Clostridium]|jgi:hypothetical protein|uniref:DUF6273 domain-containing protein n=1 Tax=Clostridium TaxID=1485 RepID=UPI0024323F0A|nr:DUF6273 domain-containing protein [Clostridium tyrobutyricum]
MQNFFGKKKIQHRVAQALLCVSVFNFGICITPQTVKSNAGIINLNIAKAETKVPRKGDIVKLSDLNVGDIFKASDIEWMVAAKNHEGYPANSVTVISQDILEKRAFDKHIGKFGSNHWGNSDLRKYLNGEFYNKLDASFRAAILETNLENIENEANDTCYNSYGAPGYNDKTYYTKDKIFIPSLEELGLKNINCARPVGTDYGTFTTNKSRRAKLNGKNYWYWTRDPYWSCSYDMCGIDSNGSYNNYLVAYSTSWGVRPVLNLKSDILLEYTGKDNLVYNGIAQNKINILPDTIKAKAIYQTQLDRLELPIAKIVWPF